MSRSISVPSNGASTRLRVDTSFGIFRENTSAARLIEVAGLQTVVKLSGSGGTGSLSITVADIDGAIRRRLNSYNVHKTEARVYQEIEDENLVVTTVLLFKGQVSTPISINLNEGTVSFDLVSDIESGEIGFSLNQNDFTIGKPIQGLEYPNGTKVTEVPASLEGRAWPVVFGSCIHVPVVGFSLEDELTASEENNDLQTQKDLIPEATVTGEEWFPIEPAFVQEYFDICLAAMLTKPGSKWVIARFYNDELTLREEGYTIESPSSVEGKANAWSTFVQINKRLKIVHPDKFKSFKALSDFCMDTVRTLYLKWLNIETLSDEKETYSSFEHYLYDLHKVKIKELFLDILKPVWPKIPLSPNNGLPRGQNPENPNRLLGDEFTPTFYNINNAKVAGYISNNVLNVIEVVPTYTNIHIVSSGDDPTMFKINNKSIKFPLSAEENDCDKDKQKNIDLTGMVLNIKVKFVNNNSRYTQLVKVNKHVKIPKKDENGSIEKDSDGNVIYEPLSEVYYTPICLLLDSGNSALNFFDTVLTAVYGIKATDFRLEVMIIESGTIVEAAPFVLPKWALNPTLDTDAAVAPLLNPETWEIRDAATFLGIKKLPSFKKPKEVLLKSKNRLGTTSWGISTGDVITEWGRFRSGKNKCKDDDGNDGLAQPSIWICNVMHNTVIKAVFAYRTIDNKKVFAEVPSSYFTVDSLRTIGNQPCTVINLANKLSLLGEGWEDQLYVTMTSPVGPNTSLICQWLISQYSDYQIDAISFDETEVSLENYPSNFAILDRKELLSTLEDIAWQCRCVIYVSDLKIYMKYLAKLSPSVKVMDSSNIIEGSVTLELSETESLVTKLIGLWKPNYQDLDVHYNLRPPRRVELRNNIDLYGVQESQKDFWIYNIESLVVKSMKFWLIRWSNTWKRVKFSTTLDGLVVETHDTITIDLSGLVANGPIDVISESITYDSSNLRLDFDVWTPVRAGEMTQFNLAFLA